MDCKKYIYKNQFKIKNKKLLNITQNCEDQYQFHNYTN